MRLTNVDIDWRWFPLLLLWLVGPANSSSFAAAPTFGRDIMPIISKAGCNLGKCHGNAQGKAGFKLSLRGVDPVSDHRAIVRDFAGRRINRLDPSASLILRKATMEVAHQGGLRFTRDSDDYRTLRDWLAAGAPGPQAGAAKLLALEVTPTNEVVIEPQTTLQLRVVAQFSDGEKRDVTASAIYEPSTNAVEVSPGGLVSRLAPGEVTVLVRYLRLQVPATLAFIPARHGFVWSAPPAHNYIDRLIDEKLAALRIQPSPLASDNEFVRRAYLDVLGVLPAIDEARRFVADTRVDKRGRLIDELLARPELADAWALRWADLLRAEEKQLDAEGVKRYHAWMRESFAANKPLDQFVRELIVARGSTYDNPPANFWRSLRDPITRAESTAQVFLGIRLACAKCHTHPFDRWTQDDYYAWAANFARLDYKIVKNDRSDKLDKHEFVGEQIVLIADKGEVQHAVTGKNAAPGFLASDAAQREPPDDRLTALADWLTASDNRQFARMQANRIWFYLLGRGIVEPIDDFRPTNPPVNGPLLEALTDDFIASGYDVRHLVRTIMNSRTYQLSSRTSASNDFDSTNFASATVRRLTAEELLDAQCTVLELPAEFNGYERGTRAGQLAGVERVRLRAKPPADGDRFLRLFGKPERLLTCECERSSETTLHQALTLVAGQDLHERLAARGGRLERLAASQSNAEIVDELYWAGLSRSPSADEQTAAQKLIAAGDDRFAGVQDLAWAIMNSAEFLLRR